MDDLIRRPCEEETTSNGRFLFVRVEVHGACDCSEQVVAMEFRSFVM